MYGYIYKITNKINGKVYVGQHKSEKFDVYYWGSGSILKQAFAKYGLENFDREVLEECNSKEELNDREIYWIAYYRELVECYNLCDGGGGTAGYHHTKQWKVEASARRKGTHLSEETKDKLRQINLGKSSPLKGRCLSEEHRKHLSEARKGEHITEETKKKLSKLLSGKNNPNYGKHFSEETKNKMSKAKKGKKLTDGHKRKLSEAHKGKPLTEETKQKMSESKKGKNNPMYGKPAHNRGKHSSEETKKKLSKATKGRRLMNNGVEVVRVHDNNFEKYIAKGYVFGQIKKYKK